jgi:hypothetical protein
LETVAVKVCDTFSGISALVAESDTVIAGTVIMAVPVTRVLKTEVAVRVTGKSLSGAVGGAVYVLAVPLAVAVGAAVPHGAGEHEIDQVTPWFFGSLATVAVNGAFPAACIVADPGFTVTVVPGTVTLEEAVTAFAATDVATTLTLKSPAGGTVGAV